MAVEKEEIVTDKPKSMITQDGKPLAWYYYCTTESNVSAEIIATQLSRITVAKERVYLDGFITCPDTFNQPVYIYKYLSLAGPFEKHHKHVSDVKLVGEFKVSSLVVSSRGILDNSITLNTDTFDVFELELKVEEELDVVIGRCAHSLTEEVRYVGWVSRRGDVALAWCSLSEVWAFEFIGAPFVINAIIAPLVNDYCKQFMIDCSDCAIGSKDSINEGARVVAVDFLNLANHVYNELRAGRFSIDMVASGIHDKLKDYRYWGVIDSRMMERFIVLVFVVIPEE